MTPKVFCIGFHKTGTTSLATALRTLGYRVTGPNGVKDPDIERNVHAMAERLVGKYGAFQDNPWPILYKHLDERYPGSRFILTVRKPASWIKSQVGHFGTKDTPMRQWIYGVGHPEGNESIYLERYEAHNREVLEHFEDRPDDLLIMDLAGGDGWEELCSFLGKDSPAIPFPHSNQARHRIQLGRKAADLLRRFTKRGA
jgi:hypothetical protein